MTTLLVFAASVALAEPSSGSAAEWVGAIVAGLCGGVPALLAAGGLWVKVAKLEAAEGLKVSRELFDERSRHIEEKLARIERKLDRALDVEDTTP